jgi:hypothetical protein
MAIDLDLYAFDNQTINTTEVDLTSNTTTLQSRTAVGFFTLVLDCSNMTATERYRMRIYEKATAASTQRIVQEVEITGVQSAEPLYFTPGLPMGNGWTFSLQLLQGTARNFWWSVRAVT